jgi:hypothetical protein
MQATDWNGVLVADLAAERAWLSEANVVRFARGPAAYDAGLGCDIFAVFPVAKPDRFCGDAAAAATSRLLRQNDRGRRRINRFDESLGARRLNIIILCVIYLPFGDCKSYFERQDLFAETGLHAVGVCCGQGILDRKVLVNPVCGPVRRLKPIEVHDQLVTQRRRFFGAQGGSRTRPNVVPAFARSDNWNNSPFVRRAS